MDEETMDILLKFLENKSQKAMKEIEENGTLSEENAIPLILKTQFNHIAHLDKELTLFRKNVDKRFESFREMVDRRFEKIDQRFEKIDQRFEKIEERFVKVYTFLGIGFTIIAALVTILKFV